MQQQIYITRFSKKKKKKQKFYITSCRVWLTGTFKIFVKTQF